MYITNYKIYVRSARERRNKKVSFSESVRLGFALGKLVSEHPNCDHSLKSASHSFEKKKKAFSRCRKNLVLFSFSLFVLR